MVPIVEPVVQLKPVEKPALSLRDIDKRLKTIREGIQQAKEVMYWRSPEIKGVETKILKIGLSYDFPQNFSLMHQEVRESSKKGDTAKKLAHLVRVERKCVSLQGRVVFLEELRFNGFINIYRICRDELRLLVEEMAQADTEEERVREVTNATRKITKLIARDFTSGEVMFRDQALEMLKALQMAITELKQQIENTEPLKSLEETIDQSMDTIFKQPELASLVKVTNLALEVPAHVNNTLTELRKVDTTYRYIKRQGWGAYAYHLAGKDGPTECFGIRIQNEVGYPASGLLDALDGLLKMTFEGEIDLESLQNSLKLYKDCIDALQRRLSQCIIEIPTRPLSEIAPLNIMANGCNMALAEARLLHAAAKELADRHTIDICKAQKALRNYLAPDDPREPLGNALRLYKAATLIQPLAPELAPNTPVERISHTVQAVYEKYVAKGLELTVEEDRVWDAAMQGRLDTLYGKNDDRTILPPSVQTLLVKQITQILHREVTKVANGELELLVSVIKSDLRYLPTCQASNEFRDVIAEYDKEYQADRRDELLLTAKGILDKIFHLQVSNMPITEAAFLYSKLYQCCFDFVTDRVLLDENTKKTDDIRSSLYLLLFKKMDSLAKEHEFARIYEKFHFKRGLEFWVTDSDGDGYTLMTELTLKSSREDGQRAGLESFLLRTLSCALYSENAQERQFAIAHINNILELDIYAQLRKNLSPAIELLIEEFTMNKILTMSSQLGTRELQRFIAGPVNMVLSRQNLPFSFNKVEHAMYVLILLEQGLKEDDRQVTRMFKQKRSEHEFATWMKAYRSFVVSAQANLKALDTLQKGGADPHLCNELVSKFGKHEADSIGRQAHLSLLYREKLNLL